MNTGICVMIMDRHLKWHPYTIGGLFYHEDNVMSAYIKAREDCIKGFYRDKRARAVTIVPTYDNMSVYKFVNQFANMQSSLDRKGIIRLWRILLDKKNNPRQFITDSGSMLVKRYRVGQYLGI
jgi:hypothetical protein